MEDIASAFWTIVGYALAALIAAFILMFWGLIEFGKASVPSWDYLTIEEAAQSGTDSEMWKKFERSFADAKSLENKCRDNPSRRWADTLECDIAFRTVSGFEDWKLFKADPKGFISNPHQR